MIIKLNILDQNVSNEKGLWQTHVSPSIVSASLTKRKKVKYAKSTEFYVYQLTLLIQ